MERVKVKPYYYAVAANGSALFFVINDPFDIGLATITAGGPAMV